MQTFLMIFNATIQPLNYMSAPYLMAERIGMPEKFSREVGSLLPVNSDFTATFLSNSLENFRRSMMLTSCNQQINGEFTRLKHKDTKIFGGLETFA